MQDKWRYDCCDVEVMSGAVGDASVSSIRSRTNGYVPEEANTKAASQ